MLLQKCTLLFKIVLVTILIMLHHYYEIMQKLLLAKIWPILFVAQLTDIQKFALMKTRYSHTKLKLLLLSMLARYFLGMLKDTYDNYQK